MLLVALSVLVYDSVYVRNYSVIHLIIILVSFVSPVFSLVLNLRVLILITIVFKSSFTSFQFLLFTIPRIYLFTFASLWVNLSSYYKSSQVKVSFYLSLLCKSPCHRSSSYIKSPCYISPVHSSPA